MFWTQSSLAYFYQKTDKIHFKVRHMIIHQNIHLFTASTAGKEMITGLQCNLSVHFDFKTVVKLHFGILSIFSIY